MEWIFYLGGVLLVLFVVKKLLPRPRDLNSATNAFLAEHYLQNVRLTPENPLSDKLKQQLVSVLRHGGIQRTHDSQLLTECFQPSHRLVQLNFVALALNELGKDPLLDSESWAKVSNPFVIPDWRHTEAVRKLLRRRHGVIIKIPDRRLTVQAWGICDGEVDQQDATPPAIRHSKPVDNTLSSSLDSETSGVLPVWFIATGPDVMAKGPPRVFRSPGCFAYLVSDVGRASARLQESDSLSAILRVTFPHALVVHETQSSRLLLLVALEQGAASAPFLCVTRSDGSRDNLGSGQDLLTEPAFIARAVELVEQYTGIAGLREEGHEGEAVWFGKRNRYNEQVAALLPEFGFTLEEAGREKTIRALDAAWSNDWNANEGAVYVACTVFGGMLRAGEPRAAEVRERIDQKSRQWIADGLVKAELIAAFDRTTQSWVQRFGGGPADQRPDKDTFVRTLVKRRVLNDPLARERGFTQAMVDNLSPTQLAGLPEASIATIVETFAMLRGAGASEDDIFARIEEHRSQIGEGVMPRPLTLERYIMYRVEVEHADTRLPEQFLAPSIAACRQYFRC